MSSRANLFGYAILILVIVCVAFLIHLELSSIFGIAGLLVGLGVMSGFQNPSRNDPG
jgi:hypothetical protein